MVSYFLGKDRAAHVNTVSHVRNSGMLAKGNMLRRVTFCADRKSPKSCSRETLSVTLPRAKPLSPENPSRHALGRDGAWYRQRMGAVGTLLAGMYSGVLWSDVG